MPSTKPTLATRPSSGDDQGEPVILGLLPSDTHGTRIAHPRPLSIVPTAPAGGDAVPSTHTTPEPTDGSTASTHLQRQPGSPSFTATNRFATSAPSLVMTSHGADSRSGCAVTAVGPDGRGLCSEPSAFSRWPLIRVPGQLQADIDGLEQRHARR